MEINKIRSLSGIYAFISAFGAAKVLNKVVVFLLFFISSQDPERYGVLAILIAVERIAMPFLDFGQKRVIYRYFDEKSNDNNTFLSSTLTTWLIMGIGSVTIFGFILIFSGYEFFFKIKLDIWFFVFLFYLVVNIVVTFYSVYFRISKQLSKYTSLMLQLNIEKFILIIVFSFLIKDVFSGYIIGCLSATLITVFVFHQVLKDIKYRVVVRIFVLKRNIKYGYPLAFEQVMSNLGPNVDKLFLSQVVSLADVGLYNLVVTIASVLTFVINIGTSYFEPVIFRMRKNVNSLIFVNRVFLSLTTVSATLTMLLVLGGIFVSSYSHVIPLFVILAIANILFTLYFYNAYVYMNLDKNTYVLIFSFIAMVADLFANYFMITEYGTYGAAWALCFYTLILSWISYFFLEYRYKNMRSRILLSLGIVSVMCIIISVITKSFLLLIPLFFVYGIIAMRFLYDNKFKTFEILRDNSR